MRIPFLLLCVSIRFPSCYRLVEVSSLLPSFVIGRHGLFRRILHICNIGRDRLRRRFDGQGEAAIGVEKVRSVRRCVDHKGENVGGLREKFGGRRR